MRGVTLERCTAPLDWSDLIKLVPPIACRISGSPARSLTRLAAPGQKSHDILPADRTDVQSLSGDVGTSRWVGDALEQEFGRLRKTHEQHAGPLRGELTPTGLATEHEQNGTCSYTCWLTAVFHWVGGLSSSNSLGRSA
jgi:hypothetical protein